MTDEFEDLLDDAPDLLAELATKRKRKARRVAQWVGCPLTWLEFVAARITSKRQLLLALMLYRRCCPSRYRTENLPVSELTAPINLGYCGLCVKAALSKCGNSRKAAQVK